MLNILCQKATGAIVHIGGTYVLGENTATSKKLSWTGQFTTYSVADVPIGSTHYINGGFIVPPQNNSPSDSEISVQKQLIKSSCYAQIAKFAPDWKQRNITVRLTELLAIDSPSQNELDEIAAIRLIWDEISRLRSVSDQLEAAVEQMTSDELYAFDPMDQSHWTP